MSSKQQDKMLFFTPEWFANTQSRKMESPRGRLSIANCRSGSELANTVVFLFLRCWLLPI